MQGREDIVAHMAEPAQGYKINKLYKFIIVTDLTLVLDPRSRTWV
jgi:hypothetical protein